MSNIVLDISRASRIAFTQNLNSSPSEILEKMKTNKKLKSKYKNTESLKMNMPSSVHKDIGKQMVAISGGGTMQQVLHSDGSYEGGRKGNTPGTGQYVMQGNRESFLRKSSKTATTKSSMLNEINQSQNQSAFANMISNCKDKVSSTNANTDGSAGVRSRNSNVDERGKEKRDLQRGNQSFRKSFKEEDTVQRSETQAKRENSISPSKGPKTLSNTGSILDYFDCSYRNADNQHSSSSHQNYFDNNHFHPDKDYINFLHKTNLITTSNIFQRKNTTKDRLYTSLELSAIRKSNKGGKIGFTRTSMEPNNEVLSRKLTPSPKSSSRIAKNEMICMSMRQFTKSFSFSFYDLPIQYKKYNEAITGKSISGVVTVFKRKTKK